VDKSCNILRPATCPLYSAADLLGVSLQALQRAPLSTWLEVRQGAPCTQLCLPCTSWEMMCGRHLGK
jgi:hypothetical protein